ncbi:MAG: hypothetical protein AVDCRST_MAG91-797 [uncultured Sphingomonadaceae bacterium]|uniref:DUF2946 domain-containing protein n=1 Tax=uncultured Sphingomonadaceae bacterium TaxID=169976 RepID=A0A6J4SD57_9SPHN|nr:MAG: hypothetical protein AVDCRST_MAG91-797 [uncultured Sphingomonadaceae bacterium]
MTLFRHLLLRHRLLACWLVAAALLMKAIVPAGYMTSVSDGSLRIELCSGFGPQKPAAETPSTTHMPGMDMTGMSHGAQDAHHGGGEEGHGQPESPCAFAGLSAPSLAGADPPLLALALAFIFAAALHVVRPQLFSAPAFLRPPLRGPPPLS